MVRQLRHWGGLGLIPEISQSNLLIRRLLRNAIGECVD